MRSCSRRRPVDLESRRFPRRARSVAGL